MNWRVSTAVSLPLALFGMTGMTAWARLNVVSVKAGDVIYISGAAGAVGNVAGQMAKSMRPPGHWIGWVNGEGLFLAGVAFDYNVGPVGQQLTVEAPDGIDVYFDNVGGTTAGERLFLRSECMAGSSPAAVSRGYNNEKPQPGPFQLL